MRIFAAILMTLGLFNGTAYAKNPAAETATTTDIEVYRSPTCGCCGKWIEHLKSNQFKVIEHLVEDVQSVKNSHGVTPALASCHTALVGGYVIEGHVPAADIKNLLGTKSPVVGLTVPGMPMGTPGMEMGAKKDAYQVLSFDKNNQTQVFSDYAAQP